MRKEMKIVVGIIITLVIAILMYSSTYNNLIELQQQAKGASSKIDAQLQRRSDLIPNLVNTVKGYSTHEESVFTEVTKARTDSANAKTLEDKLSANDQLNRSIKIVVEAYPELKASESFLKLQDDLAGTENRITVARNDYNNAIVKYNTYKKGFFVSIVFGNYNMFSDMKTFEASPEAIKNPTVDFK